MLNASLNLTPFALNHIYHFKGKEGTVIGKVCQVDINFNDGYQEIIIDTQTFKTSQNIFETNGRLLLKIYEIEKIVAFNDIVKAEVILTEPSLPGNYGEFNYREYLAQQKIFLTDNIKTNQIEIIGNKKEINLASILNDIKTNIIDKIEKIYRHTDARAIIKAVVIGDRSEITEELKDVFQVAGVMHILAISGLHVGIIAMVLFLLFSTISDNKLSKSFKYIFIIIIMLGYAAITGFRPSVSRATLMFIVLLGAKLLNRPYNVYNSISIAAFLILLWQPLYLFDTGFILSFTATFFIIFLTPIMESILKDCLFLLPDYLVKSLSVSASAWLGVMPLSAFFFYKISIISILSNILIVPVIGFIIIFALFSIFLSFLFLPLGNFLALVNNGLISLLIFIGEKLSLLPFAYRDIAQPGILSIAIYYIIIVFIFYSLKYRYNINILKNKITIYSTIILILLVISINILKPSPLLAVHFINVGQGDSILIQTPEKQNILIDGGGTPFSDYDMGKNVVIPYLRRQGVNHLDIMVLTHPDLDHMEGLLPVLEEIKVDLVIDSNIPCQEEIYKDFLALIKKNGKTTYHKTQAGDKIEVCKDIDIFIINPIYSDLTINENNFNNNSIVLKLRYENINFLFTGDIEEEIEKKILSNNASLNSNILKVAHHGSISSTSTKFLDAVAPEVAVISVGSNNFGHPHPDVIKKLENRCQQVFSTDRNGTVLVKTNGKNIYIDTLR